MLRRVSTLPFRRRHMKSWVKIITTKAVLQSFFRRRLRRRPLLYQDIDCVAILILSWVQIKTKRKLCEEFFVPVSQKNEQQQQQPQRILEFL